MYDIDNTDEMAEVARLLMAERGLNMMVSNTLSKDTLEGVYAALCIIQVTLNDRCAVIGKDYLQHFLRDKKS